MSDEPPPGEDDAPEISLEADAEIEANDDSPHDESPAVAAMRHLTDRRTTESVKKTILTYILIRAVRDSGTARRRSISAIVLALGLMALQHWHMWSVVTHLLR
jgi:hypothetical protein